MEVAAPPAVSPAGEPKNTKHKLKKIHILDKKTFIYLFICSNTNSISQMIIRNKLKTHCIEVITPRLKFFLTLIGATLQ